MLVASKPSSWLSSSSIVRCTSESPPPDPLSMRAEPMLSTSSMKMMDGACSLEGNLNSFCTRVMVVKNDVLLLESHRNRPEFPDLAMTKSSRTMRDPSPMYFCTSSEPETRMKVQSVWCATARASSVLPVPGGPYRSTPCCNWMMNNVAAAAANWLR